MTQGKSYSYRQIVSHSSQHDTWQRLLLPSNRISLITARHMAKASLTVRPYFTHRSMTQGKGYSYRQTVYHSSQHHTGQKLLYHPSQLAVRPYITHHSTTQGKSYSCSETVYHSSQHDTGQRLLLPSDRISLITAPHRAKATLAVRPYITHHSTTQGKSYSCSETVYHSSQHHTGQKLLLQ